MRFFDKMLRRMYTTPFCTPCLAVAVTTAIATCDAGDELNFPSGNKGGMISAVGNTPLIYLRTVSEATGCNVYGKAEFMNPTSSVKDRAAKYLIEEAEKSGVLKPGGMICEGTGGNTGVALAHLGVSKGYKVVLCMPNSISTEKINHQRRLGAEVWLQPLVPFSDPENYARKAEILAKERAAEGAIFTNQFENNANFNAHYNTTGPEIWVQTRGEIDGFVTSAGTGGTISGISACLKNLNPKIQTYLVDPPGSVLYSYVTTGKCEVGVNTGSAPAMEGIGIARITANMAKANLDGAFISTDQEAVDMAYNLLKQDGIYVGPSAALNVTGAVKLARKLGPGKTIVTVLCDGGERYVSKLYNDEWLSANNLTPTPGAADDKTVSFVKQVGCGNKNCPCGEDCSCVKCDCGEKDTDTRTKTKKETTDIGKKESNDTLYNASAIDAMPTRRK